MLCAAGRLPAASPSSVGGVQGVYPAAARHQPLLSQQDAPSHDKLIPLLLLVRCLAQFSILGVWAALRTLIVFTYFVSFLSYICHYITIMLQWQTSYYQLRCGLLFAIILGDTLRKIPAMSSSSAAASASYDASYQRNSLARSSSVACLPQFVDNRQRLSSAHKTRGEFALIKRYE